MLLLDAQNRIGELADYNIALSDVLGTDAFLANVALLATASEGIATADDLDAFVAEIESQMILDAAPEPEETDFDNSGAVVELANGETVSYDAWDGTGDGDAPEDTSDVPLYTYPDLTEWDAHRKATVGLADMAHLFDLG